MQKVVERFGKIQKILEETNDLGSFKQIRLDKLEQDSERLEIDSESLGKG